MCWTSAHNYLWRNKASLAKYDHTKPSPYVTPKFLLRMRIIFAVLLFCGIVLTIVAEGGTTLVYLGGWTLYLTLIEFIILVIAQVRNKRKLASTELNLDFDVPSPMNIKDSRLLNTVTEEAEEEDEDTKESRRNTFPEFIEVNEEKEETYQVGLWGLWQWVILGYQTCFSLGLVVLYMIAIDFGEGKNKDVSSLELTASITHHALPALLLMIEYPFNQIPFDWRHYPVTILVVLPLYILFTVLYQVISEEPIYPFDWFNEVLTNLGLVAGMVAAATLNFAILWALTSKLKLPSYQKVEEEKRLRRSTSWVQHAKLIKSSSYVSSVSRMTDTSQETLASFGGSNDYRESGLSFGKSPNLLAQSSQTINAIQDEDEDYQQARLQSEYEKRNYAAAPANKIQLIKYGKTNDCRQQNFLSQSAQEQNFLRQSAQR